MRLRQLDSWVWTLIYGGLLTLGLGLFANKRDTSLGWALMLAGGGVALIGLILIFVRAHASRQEQSVK